MSKADTLACPSLRQIPDAKDLREGFTLAHSFRGLTPYSVQLTLGRWPGRTSRRKGMARGNAHLTAAKEAKGQAKTNPSKQAPMIYFHQD